MLNFETFLLGLALAMHAAVGSFGMGVLGDEEKRTRKFWKGGLTSLIFAFFQFFMLWLGGQGGDLLSFSHYGHYYPFVVAAIFLYLGIRLFLESFVLGGRPDHWGLLPLLALGFNSGLNAFAAGIGLGTLPKLLMISLEIGLITFVLCALFYLLAQYFKHFPGHWPLRFAGLVFLRLGGNIVWGHVIKGAL